MPCIPVQTCDGWKSLTVCLIDSKFRFIPRPPCQGVIQAQFNKRTSHLTSCFSSLVFRIKHACETLTTKAFEDLPIFTVYIVQYTSSNMLVRLLRKNTGLCRRIPNMKCPLHLQPSRCTRKGDGCNLCLSNE